MKADEIIETVVAILERDIDHCHVMADAFRLDGDYSEESKQIREACALRGVLWMLTNEDFRNKMARLYLDE